MRKIGHKQPFLNSLAGKLGFIAGSVAEATQSLTGSGSTDVVPGAPAKSSARPSKKDEGVTSSRRDRATSTRLRSRSVRGKNGARPKTSKKKR